MDWIHEKPIETNRNHMIFRYFLMPSDFNFCLMMSTSPAATPLSYARTCTAITPSSKNFRKASVQTCLGVKFQKLLWRVSDLPIFRDFSLKKKLEVDFLHQGGLKSKVYCRSCACEAGDTCSIRPSVSNQEKRTKKLPQFWPKVARRPSIHRKDRKGEHYGNGKMKVKGWQKIQKCAAKARSAFS